MAVDNSSSSTAQPEHGEGKRDGPVAQSDRVCLFGMNKAPTIDGKPKGNLTDAQYNVIQALIEATTKGLNKDELITQSGHGGAREVLTTLSKKDSDSKSVIQFAGKTGRRYRIK